MAETVTVDLRMTATQRNALKTAVTTLETLLDTARARRVLELWPTLPPEVQAQFLAKSPLFARLLEVGRRLP